MPSIISEPRQTKLREIINEYVTGGEQRKVPGLMYVAFREDGEPIFEHYAGTRGISSLKPMDSDTVFWMASFTKLIVSIASMQLVEQGVLHLDDAEQIEELAPELRDVKVLTKHPNGELKLVDKETRVTLRMLLNHTAGFGYAFEDAKLAEYGRPIGFDDFCGELSDLMRRPLINQPGTKFQYGTSGDWVGILIERVSRLNLENYIQQNILEPVGIRSISFLPSEEAKSNLAYLHQRASDGSLSLRDHLYRKPFLRQPGSSELPFCAGGHGCYGKPAEFAKLIAVLLNDGVDAQSGIRLLRKETVDTMFTDQIPDIPRFSNNLVAVCNPMLANPTPLTPMPESHTEGWGLGFSLSHFATETGRPAGVGSWEGLANLFWLADRQNKVGAVIASQIMPYGDSEVIQCSERLECEIYKAIQEAQS